MNIVPHSSILFWNQLGIFIQQYEHSIGCCVCPFSFPVFALLALSIVLYADDAFKYFLLFEDQFWGVKYPKDY